MGKRVLVISADQTEQDQIGELLAESIDRALIERAAAATEALERLDKRNFDFVIAGMNVGGMSGVEVLSEIWRRHPKAARFLVGSEGDKTVATQCALGSHHFMVKPIDRAKFKEAVARVFAVENLIESKKLKALVAQIRTFPSLPSVYFRVTQELNSPNASAASVAEIVAQDLAITTKIIQIVNSAYYGLRRQVVDLNDAILMLGMETIRSLVMGIHVFSQSDKVKPVYFSIDKIWRHSLAVAQRARAIAQLETGDDKIADEAYTAGLLHDIGKLVLACNWDEQYAGALKLAQKNQLPPWEVEAEVFGASHAETGAYLASRWGMPPAIVEAIAFHHRPSAVLSDQFSILTAVHAATVLVHEEMPEKDGFLMPAPDKEYLQNLGLADQWEAWRNPETAKPAARRNAEQAGQAAARPAAKVQAKPRRRMPRWWPQFLRWWPLGACGVALLSLLVFSWIRSPEPTSERTFAVWPRLKHAAANKKKAVVAAPAPAVPVAPVAASAPPETKPVAAPPTKAVEVSAPAAAPTAATQAKVPAAAPAPPPAVATQPKLPAAAPAPGAGTNAAAPAAPPAPEFTLQGIFYRKANPSAMVNHRLIHEGDKIQGAKVKEITPQSVVLEIDGEKKVLEVK